MQLPPNWSEIVDPMTQQVVYVNHETKATTWLHPLSPLRKRVLVKLPQNWRQDYLPDGTVFYVNQSTKQVSLKVPQVEGDGRDEEIEPCPAPLLLVAMVVLTWIYIQIVLK